MGKDRGGKAFERLVAHFERALAHDRSRTVEYSKKLQHLHTGARREFDVLITFNLGHHTFVTAIECKDHGRPISVKELEAFKAKVDGCPVNRGCLVGRSFTKETRKLARHFKIGCLTVAQMERSSWLAREIEIKTLCFHRDAWITPCPGDPHAEDLRPYSIHDSDTGDELPARHFNRLAGEILLRHGFPGHTDARVAKIEISSQPGFELRFYDMEEFLNGVEVVGERYRTDRIQAEVLFSWEVRTELLDFYGYGSDIDDAHFATVDVRVDLAMGKPRPVKMLIQRGKDGRTQVSAFTEEGEAVPVRRVVDEDRSSAGEDMC